MPGSNPPAFRRLVASQLHAASDKLRRSHSLRLRREYDLSLVEWRTVCLIEFMQPVRLRDVAAESSADKAQISRIVTALVKRGLVVRQEYVGDARSAMLELTPAGVDLAARLSQLGDERDKVLRAAVGEADTQTLLRALAVVKERAALMVEEEERLAASLPITPRSEYDVGDPGHDA